MKNLVNIKLHGALGKGMKKSSWKLAVSSVAEAINAINNMTGDRLKKLLIKATKKNVKYASTEDKLLSVINCREGNGDTWVINDSFLKCDVSVPGV